MEIQTAGEQKYYELIEEQIKTLRTHLIMWVSLLAVALIAAIGNLLLGCIIGAIGVVLTVKTIKKQRELQVKTDHILDKADFFNQLISPESVEIKSLSLIITKTYLLSYGAEHNIYLREELKQIQIIEVARGKKLYQTLCVNDQTGSQHEVASCEQKGSQSAAMMLAYETLHI